MPLQFDAKIVVTLIAGSSGSGKTTMAIRNLVSDRKLTTRFIFDNRSEFSQRLGLPNAETPEEMTMATEDGFCLFAPGAMFPGNPASALRYFCKFAFDTSFHLPGRKLLLIDEVWKFCNPNSIPQELSECIQEGRKHGLEMMFLTQRPNRLNEAILNEVTELICFNMRGENARECLEESGINPAEIIAFEKGQFVAINTENGGAELRGNIFTLSGFKGAPRQAKRAAQRSQNKKM